MLFTSRRIIGRSLSSTIYGWLHGTVAALRIGCAVLLIAALAAGNVAAQHTWAERLGYPTDRPVVILYAGQVGLCHETNQAARDLLAEGFVNSVSVMPVCPGFEGFANWCRTHAEHDVGISLTMTSEWANYRWQPVSSENAVESIVDAQGYLCSSPLQFSLRANSHQVAKEIDAQILKVRIAGIQPTHLTPHLGALLTRPDLAEIYLNTAMKHWIPAVMVDLKPEHIARFRARGIPIKDEMIDVIAAYSLPKLDDLQFIPTANAFEEKRQAFLDLLSNLGPGITQIVGLPAIESSGLKSITEHWKQRVWDRELLLDSEVRQKIREQGIILTDWKEMMERFEGKNPWTSSPVDPPASSTPQPGM